mmetsp:Transcript_49386/g.141560  ORF Transcript_49386/g.141560 Transcript_49386/m.141560 type:complete len:204 (-) Transcript_49386:622-1233(-)
MHELERQEGGDSQCGGILLPPRPHRAHGAAGHAVHGALAKPLQGGGGVADKLEYHDGAAELFRLAPIECVVGSADVGVVDDDGPSCTQCLQEGLAALLMSLLYLPRCREEVVCGGHLHGPQLPQLTGQRALTAARETSHDQNHLSVALSCRRARQDLFERRWQLDTRLPCNSILGHSAMQSEPWNVSEKRRELARLLDDHSLR